ncbi:hypothetical protein B0H16DRAFT_1604523 [Mycena metata]|uniref:Uncharacterized protein n=1 Tax=Mycena metata TaxID=1033252 RepID=A0AAD7HGW2_9AGAR|nr:hypothetical protein B0H16DRAFT_1604523 [Mycena metata]
MYARNTELDRGRLMLQAKTGNRALLWREISLYVSYLLSFPFHFCGTTDAMNGSTERRPKYETDCLNACQLSGCLSAGLRAACIVPRCGILSYFQRRPAPRLPRSPRGSCTATISHRSVRPTWSLPVPVPRCIDDGRGYLFNTILVGRPFTSRSFRLLHRVKLALILMGGGISLSLPLSRFMPLPA